MFLTKLKVAATVLLFVAVLSGGAGVVTYQKLAAQPPNREEGIAPKVVVPTQQQTEQAIQKEAERLQDLATAVVTPEDKLKAILDEAKVGEKLKALLSARLNAANTALNARWKEYCASRGTLDILIASSRRVLEAERDLGTNKANQMAALESHLQRMQQLYVINLARYNTGRLSIQDLAQADYERLDAEIGLERAKAQGK